MAKILDGKKIAQKFLSYIRQEIKKLKLKPCLLVLLVGDDRASEIFVQAKRRACQKVGVQFHLKRAQASASEKEVCNLLRRLDQKLNPDGIVVQLPLPPQINPDQVIRCIPPDKDVDSLAGEKVRSPVALGIVALLSSYRIEICGKYVVIVGAGRLVGRPVADLLVKLGAKVSLCDLNIQDLAQITRKAEILVSGVGKESLIAGDMVKQGVVVVDAGIVLRAGEIRGDVDWASVAKKASYLTPVPGGVGPMTVAMLLLNLLELTQHKRSIKN